MKKVFSYIAARLSEPSTWVSLGTMATAVGWTIAPEYWQPISAVGMGLGGLIGVILKERNNA